MNKKQIEEVALVNEAIEDVQESIENKKNRYYGTSRYNLKKLNKIKTACSRADITISEDTEWTKYGPSITGREIMLADLPALLSELKNIKSEIEVGEKVKKQYASTTKGDTTYSKSAIKHFEMRQNNESYRDAQERLSTV